jgi:hypothetical protein
VWRNKESASARARLIVGVRRLQATPRLLLSPSRLLNPTSFATSSLAGLFRTQEGDAGREPGEPRFSCPWRCVAANLRDHRLSLPQANMGLRTEKVVNE